MKWQEGINVLEGYECEVAFHGMRHYIYWLDTVQATTKSAEPYGRPIKEEMAIARKMMEAFKTKGRMYERERMEATHEQ